LDAMIALSNSYLMREIRHRGCRDGQDDARAWSRY
jgi:hypothetical protein